MRIAIDIRSLMEGRHSGVEEYTIQIIRHMVRVAPRHNYHVFYNSVRPVTLPELPSGVQIHAFRYPNKIFNVTQWLLGWPHWDALVPADVFFVPNPRLVPLSAEAPYVAVAHDLSFARFPEFLDQRRRLWHRMMRPKLLMRHADHIIAVSEYTKQDLMALYGIAPEKISVISSGITPHLGPPRPAQLQKIRRKYKLPASYILYFGRLEPRKNIRSILRAFSAMAQVLPHHVVIAGESGWRQHQIYRAIENTGTKNRIHLLGFVPEEDKAALYAGADLFVYPSFYEGFGFPPLESLVCGTPVVTSFNSALPQIVGTWTTLIDPYDPAQLGIVMKELLAEPARVPEEIRRNVRDRYSWDRAAQETMRVIEAVA